MASTKASSTARLGKPLNGLLPGRRHLNAGQWQQQTHLAKATKGQQDSGSLLSGLLYDETGDRLSPSHAIKNGIRYRYYVSQRLMQARRKDATGWRLPAKALEDVVVAELAGLLEIIDNCRRSLKQTG